MSGIPKRLYRSSLSRKQLINHTGILVKRNDSPTSSYYWSPEHSGGTKLFYEIDNKNEEKRIVFFRTKESKVFEIRQPFFHDVTHLNQDHHFFLSFFFFSLAYFPVFTGGKIFFFFNSDWIQVHFSTPLRIPFKMAHCPVLTFEGSPLMSFVIQSGIKSFSVPAWYAAHPGIESEHQVLSDSHIFVSFRRILLLFGTKFQYSRTRRQDEARGGGGYSQKSWVGVWGPLPKTLTLFMTQICDFPYPIYGLTKNLIPFLWEMKEENNTITLPLENWCSLTVPKCAASKIVMPVYTPWISYKRHALNLSLPNSKDAI